MTIAVIRPYGHAMTLTYPERKKYMGRKFKREE